MDLFLAASIFSSQSSQLSLTFLMGGFLAARPFVYMKWFAPWFTSPPGFDASHLYLVDAPSLRDELQSVMGEVGEAVHGECLAQMALQDAKNEQEAFVQAEKHDEMETFETGLGEKGSKEQHMSIAKYYEKLNRLSNAAKHYALCEEYGMALELYKKVGEKEIDNAIAVVGKARNDALTHSLVDYLMGEGPPNNAPPKDPVYVYRLHKALGNYMQAAGTALLIAKQEQEMGNYKAAHGLLFRSYQDLKSQKMALPQELWRPLMILHSYMIVRRLVKAGDHANAAHMLLQIGRAHV